MSTEFPTHLFPEILASPADFGLIQRIPVTQKDALFPIAINMPTGDEEPMWLVDVETTGFDSEVDRIIELGIVKATYSPSQKRITAILEVYSQYEDPGRPIPEAITELTGITDQDVTGAQIDDDWLGSMVGTNDPLIIAHNAVFDRSFLDSRFSCLKGLRWGCTVNEIPWRELGFGSRSLEYLLLRMGWFFEGHRAGIDCLATVWMLVQQPEAFASLLDAVSRETVVVRAFGAPFDVKDRLKGRGYRWHPGDAGSNKCWWKEIPEDELSAEQAWLNEIYHNGGERAGYESRCARARHSSPVA